MSQAAPHADVLLAENDSMVRGLIRSVLLSAEHAVFLAADGVEAVTLARQFQAGLVLLDIGMPRLNGLLACHEIRGLPGYAAVPIVMLTGFADQRMRDAALALGATDFITKPFRPDLLLARLAAHLGGKPAWPRDGDAPPAAPGQAWTLQRDRPIGPGADTAEGRAMTEGRRALDIRRSTDRGH